MMNPFFHLTFRPNIRLVSSVREFTVNFYRRMLADREVSSRLALATHELLENAVSYAADDETTVRVEMLDGQLTIRTWNRSNEDNTASLRNVIDEMNATTDPNRFYLALMERTALSPEGSGLGLARVRAEADMTITYKIENNEVCIEAKMPIRSGAVAA